jgi:xanthine dehydrogenase accessory factor
VSHSTGNLYTILRAAIDSLTPVALATIVSGPGLGAKLLVLPDRVEGGFPQPGLDDVVAVAARELLEQERSETKQLPLAGSDEQVEVFIETFPPPPLLVIFGAVHVAQSLCTFAKQLGFRVFVTDARATLATEERFPEADRIIRAWPDDAISELEISRNTYVAILTHDPKFDEPALIGALATEARYIGAVGSRKTNRDRRQRLTDAGVSAESIARVRGPIGLDIGADTPDEMAISILAEIIAVRHGRAGGSLTEASGPIRGTVPT